MADVRRTAAVLVGLGVVVAMSSWAVEEGLTKVVPSVENFRDRPNGRKLGTLLQGTRIERISQDGKWVRFRVEGWIWGPSLEGFRNEKDESGERTAEPPMPVHDATPRIKRFVDQRQATFYSVEYDSDLQRITLRFRVPAVEPEALERKQMKIQRELLDILGGKVDCRRIRVESNRDDGSGRVGLEIAEIAADSLATLDRDDLEGWRQVTRVSHDAGRTWNQ